MDFKRKTIGMFLVLGALFSTSAGPLPVEPHIYVEGYAEVEAPADQMLMEIRIQQTEIELADAKRIVDERSTKLIELCTKLGITDDNLSTSALTIRPHLEYESRRGDEAPEEKVLVSRNVEITLKNLEQYPEVIAALVESNVSETLSTKLTLSDIESLADSTQMKALENARQRAESLARAQGMKLGKPHSISQFYTRDDDRYEFSPNPLYKSAMQSDQPLMSQFGSNSEPFLPGTITVSSKVYVVYYLNE